MITNQSSQNERSLLRRLPFRVLSTTFACALVVSACNGDDDTGDDADSAGAPGSGGRAGSTGGRSSGSGGRTQGTGGLGEGGVGAAQGAGGGSSGGTGGGSSGGASGGVTGMAGDGGLGGTGPTVPCDSDNGGIELPEGFCAVLAAEGLGRARHVTVSPSGDVFVAVSPSPGGSEPGRIIALRDADQDGKLEERTTFNTRGGNGIVWRNGALYFAENDRVLKYTLPDGRLAPTSEPEVIVSGLPTSGDHPSKTIALSDDETLFVNIGSASNSCQFDNREPGSPGQEPCEELEERAGIWVFDPTVSNQEQSDGQRFAAGTRNANALAIQPSTAALWAVANGRDQLYQNWPELFDPTADILLPSEGLYLVEDGAHYGWPYCYHDPAIGLVLAPEYGGDGQTTADCASYLEPDFAFPGHWAPLGAVFYEGDQFPERYQGGLFVAFHGSRFEPNATGDLPGYQVGFLPFNGDEPTDAFETFASGFAGDSRPLPTEAAARPVGVTVAPDGSLYITDDHGGNLWRVFYTGE